MKRNSAPPVSKIRVYHGRALLLTSAVALLSFSCSPSSGDDSVRSVTASVTSDSAVFINEIHYDNVGTDSGEAIEIAGPAGTDLAGLALVLYNGSGGAVYNTLPLSGVITNEGGSYGTLVFNLPENGIQNGAPDGVALVDGSTVIEFLSYEGTFTAVGGPADGMLSTDIGVTESSSTPVGFSLQRVGTGDSALHFTWASESAASMGQVNAGQSFTTGGGDGDGDGDGDGGGDGDGDGEGEEEEVGACGDAFTPIFEVQGSGDVSPLTGVSVVVEGVVVGDFQGSGEDLGGFFVQSESPDLDPVTSEGVFVFDQNTPASIDVSLGDRVRVSGSVTEHFGLTEIVASTVLACAPGALPTPTPVPLPYADASQLEALEGMLVSVSDVTVTETYDLGRYGEVALSVGGRLFNPTNGGGETPASNLARRILLDDARDFQNLEPVPYLGIDGTLRIGDTASEVTAVLSYGFDTYRLQPIDRHAIAFTRANPRPTGPAEVGGDVRVASLNVLNYFTTLNERGANSALELERQRAKLVQAVIGLNADVLGLMEIENNDAITGAPTPLDDFVASVNAALGAEVYARALEPDFTGTDAIRSAIIYKPTQVEALDWALADADPIHDRPPIAQAFSYQGNRFTVVVNHFKSKGSCPSDAADPNSDFGQGCWNLLRTQQSQALLSFVGELQDVTGDDDVVVLGDLNSYLAEDPIQTLESGGLINRIFDLPAPDRYSYVFFGEAGVLDYAITTPSLDVTGTTIWHINADEPRILDYNTEFNPASAYQPDAYRSSDHDPVLIGLSLPPEPLALLGELKSGTLDVIQEADLRLGQQAQLLVPLGLAEAALKRADALEGHPFLAAVHLRLARKALEHFIDRVQHLEKQGHLEEEQALPIIEEAETLISVIG